MKFELYAIYDTVSEEYGPVFQAKNLPVATRYVDDMVRGTNIKLSDYFLKHLGYFDSDGGSLTTGNEEVYRLDHIITLDSEPVDSEPFSDVKPVEDGV